MRAWGRSYNEDGTYQWVAVVTDANGFNDDVYLVALCQCLKLNTGESPIYANSGIPAQQSVVTQIFPDFYLNQIQQLFAPFFVKLTIARQQSPTPTYQINVQTHYGATISRQVPY